MEDLKESHSPEVLALRDRVKLGNEKLFQAWQQIRELAEDKEEWSRQMDRLHQAWLKLDSLCTELKLRGYSNCLYLSSEGKKAKRCLDEPGGFWCQVCSSNYPYWSDELMSLPSSSVVREEGKGSNEQRKITS